MGERAVAPDASNLWQGTDSKQGPPCSILIRLTGSGGRRFAGVAEDWVRRAGRLDAVVVRQSTSSKRKSCTGIHSALTPGTEADYIKDVVGTERRSTRRLCSPVQPCGTDVDGTLRTKTPNLSGERLTQDLCLRRAEVFYIRARRIRYLSSFLALPHFW